MLKPPFSRPTAPPPPPSSTPPCLNESLSIATATSIRYTLPATIRRGNTLARITDDTDAYYMTEVGTARLGVIKSYLWLAGLPNCARPLHRQQLLGREFIIAEDSNEHLVWHETRIFIKPLPMFLVDLDCGTRKICKTKLLHEAACGFLLSYAWLVRHESDLRIAREKGLLPDAIDWRTWTTLVDDFLERVDLRSLSGVSFGYRYGELRLSRLNKIYCITRFTWRDFVRFYVTVSTWKRDFFARNFAWLLEVFAVTSVALSAMQVILAIATGGKAFANASYGFSIASLFLTAGTALAMLLFWALLFVYHLVSARTNNQHVMEERKSFANSQRDLGC